MYMPSALSPTSGEVLVRDPERILLSRSIKARAFGPGGFTITLGPEYDIVYSFNKTVFKTAGTVVRPREFQLRGDFIQSQFFLFSTGVQPGSLSILVRKK
jgi:hypothetical protein